MNKKSTTKKIKFLISILAICIAAVFCITGCASEDLIKKELDISTNRYVANSYSQDNRIKYSYSYNDEDDNEYDFYYIYLGELKNIPLYSFDVLYHTGVNREFSFSTAEETSTDISNAVARGSSEALGVVEENTVVKGTENKVGVEVGASVKAGAFGVEVEASVKASAETSFKEEVSNTKSNSFEKTTSLEETVSTTVSQKFAKTVAQSFSLTKEDNNGYYRLSLVSVSDIYLYIIKDADGNFVHYEFKECVIPNSYSWDVEYSEEGFFRKNDSSRFELDTEMLNNLPKPEVHLGGGSKDLSSNSLTDINTTTKNVFAVMLSNSDINNNKAITIPACLEVLNIKGVVGHTFTDVSFAVAPRTTKLTLNFFDFSFTAPSSTIAINADCDLDLNITGSCNIRGGNGITSSSSDTSKQPGGIGINANNLTITGTGELKVYGGNGGAGSGTKTGTKVYNVGQYEYVTVGMSGGNGGDGILCSNLTTDVKSLAIVGGSGGNGNTSYAGSRGGSGAYGVSTLSMKNLNNSAVIVTGGSGGNGKNLFYSTSGGSSVNMGGGGYGRSAVSTDTTGKITKYSGTNGISYS